MSKIKVDHVDLDTSQYIKLTSKTVTVCNSTQKPESDNCTRDEETASRFKGKPLLLSTSL